MWAGWKMVTLAIIALFTISLRAPLLPALEPGPDSAEQVTAYRAAALPALAPARPGRSLEGARKVLFLALLPCCPALPSPLSVCATLAPLTDQLRSLPVLPRTSRGPPAFT